MRPAILWFVLIVYLGYLAVTGAFALREWLDRKAAQKAVADLRSGILMYHTEYKRFPVTAATSGANTVLTTSSEDGLIDTLCPITPPLRSRSPAPYFSTTLARTSSGPGIWRQSTGSHVRDQWGSFYLVYFDTDYDGKLEISYPDGTVETLMSPLAVRSLGRNCLIDHTPGFRDDDVMAY